MAKTKQRNKYKLHRTEKKNFNEKIWKSLYLLEVLVVKEDSERVDREKGD
jgi:hypothetical protein